MKHPISRGLAAALVAYGLTGCAPQEGALSPSAGPSAGRVLGAAAGIGALAALALAERRQATLTAELAWLTAMDGVFALAAGRAAPEGAAKAFFTSAEARLAPMLADGRYRASGLGEVMDPAGAPLSFDETLVLIAAIGAAERARARFAGGGDIGAEGEGRS
ncbi:MAG: hypothetical protein ACK5MQ_15055 [Pikeienuella sp.]